MLAELVAYGLVGKGKLLVHIVKPDLGAYLLGGKLGKYLPAVAYGAPPYICNNDPFIFSYHKTCSFRDDPALAVLVVLVHLTKKQIHKCIPLHILLYKNTLLSSFFPKNINFGSRK